MSLVDALRTLPKTELHLHLLGALPPASVVELARRAGSPLRPAAERAVAGGGHAFADLPAFVAYFIGHFELLLRKDDLERVTYEVLEDAAQGGVRWAELRLTPTSHLVRGADEDDLFAGIEAGRRAAWEAHGIESRVIVDFPRTLPLQTAETALAVALRQRGRGVTGFDVAGDERAVAVDPAFAPVFAAARRGGLHLTAHAGEAAGPASVAGALDVYGARRIGHGTRAIEDPRLVERLARERVVLEVCASSNVALGVVPSIAAHPLPAFLAAGVRCVPSTDDPTLFGTDAATEYARLHDEAGIDLATLGRLAADGFTAAFVEPGKAGDATRERLEAWRREALAWESGHGSSDPA